MQWIAIGWRNWSLNRAQAGQMYPVLGRRPLKSLKTKDFTLLYYPLLLLQYWQTFTVATLWENGCWWPHDWRLGLSGKSRTSFYFWTQKCLFHCPYSFSFHERSLIGFAVSDLAACASHFPLLRPSFDLGIDGHEISGGRVFAYLVIRGWGLQGRDWLCFIREQKMGCVLLLSPFFLSQTFPGRDLGLWPRNL